MKSSEKMYILYIYIYQYTQALWSCFVHALGGYSLTKHIFFIEENVYIYTYNMLYYITIKHVFWVILYRWEFLLNSWEKWMVIWNREDECHSNGVSMQEKPLFFWDRFRQRRSSVVAALQLVLVALLVHALAASSILLVLNALKVQMWRKLKTH